MSSELPGRESAHAMRAMLDELALSVALQFTKYQGDVSASTVNPAPGLDEVRAVSLVGFTGHGFRGALTLVVPIATVLRIQHDLLEDPDPNVWRGTASEQANMLVGRWKNRLVAHRILMEMTTPATVIGTDVHVEEDVSGFCEWFSFEGGGIVVHVRCHVEFDEDFAIQEEQDEGPPLSEGTLTFF